MERPKPAKSVKNVEEGISVEDGDQWEDGAFNRSLVGKIWTDSPYNVRAFKSTMLQAWRVKNQVEIQDLSKNLFLFRFGSKRESESVLSNGPWSFDRNLVILERVTGDEQPSDMVLNKVSFWIRIYDLPLKLRSDVLAMKLGNLIGGFEEVDQRDQHRIGKFLRIKVSLDLRKPLRRGTNVKFQGRDMWVAFKYERLPSFCFVCGRIGHQMKDCEEPAEEDFSELEERDQAFGPWLRASPLPKFTEEIKREANSGSCSKSLFSQNSNSKGPSTEKLKNNDEEVTQRNAMKDPVIEAIVVPTTATPTIMDKDVEEVAESLGTVALQVSFHPGECTPKSDAAGSSGKKWTRKKGSGSARKSKPGPKAKELGKRSLVEVALEEGYALNPNVTEKKLKGDVVMDDASDTAKEVVLIDQHHRSS